MADPIKPPANADEEGFDPMDTFGPDWAEDGSMDEPTKESVDADEERCVCGYTGGDPALHADFHANADGAPKEEHDAVAEIGQLLAGLDDDEPKHLWRDLMFGFGVICLRCKDELTRPEMSKMTPNQVENKLHERCSATSS